MASYLDPECIFSIHNNTGRLDIVYDEFLYTQKTNLINDGKKCCLYRCKNKKKCSSRISLKTGIVDGKNAVIQPFQVSSYKILHHVTCEKQTHAQLNEKILRNKIKEAVRLQPHRPPQQIFEEQQTMYLSSSGSEVDSLKDYAEVKHVYSYLRNKTRYF